MTEIIHRIYKSLFAITEYDVVVEYDDKGSIQTQYIANVTVKSPHTAHRISR